MPLPDPHQRLVTCLFELPRRRRHLGVLVVTGWPATCDVAGLGVGGRGDLAGLHRLDPALPAPHWPRPAVNAIAIRLSTIAMIDTVNTTSSRPIHASRSCMAGILSRVVA